MFAARAASRVVAPALRAPVRRMGGHDAAEAAVEMSKHLKIRAKPYPWSCPDCNLFDSACWKACKEK
ncbi:hypothetical protein SO694_00137077 [Aureococcus anophagefferens]|uniref:RanBP2-type domain-containing protein n=1 Tax=Aureococcus anophagefferens TaxID=44056 RepID=A0ABR1GFS9_AURAN